jgi:hypothetical protein
MTDEFHDEASYGALLADEYDHSGTSSTPRAQSIG